MLILTKKDHQDQTKNAKVMRFQNFPNFAKNFTQFLGYGVCWGENYGEEKKFSKKNLFWEKNFLGYFFIFRKYLWGSFLYFTVCTLINFTCTRSNLEGVI